MTEIQPQTPDSHDPWNATPLDLIARRFDSHSHLIEKTTEDLRARLNEAVIAREPPTYQAIYDKFDLRAKGVSFSAFYKYARRLRFHVALAEEAENALGGEIDIRERLASFAATRALEAVLDPGASPRTVERLMNAYRMASRIGFEGESLAADMARVVSQTPERLAGPYCELRRSAARRSEEVIARRMKADREQENAKTENK